MNRNAKTAECSHLAAVARRVVFGIAFAAAPFADATETTNVQITRMEDERYRAMIAKDARGLAAVMADDFIYQHTTGNIYTREQFVDQIVAGAIQIRSATRQTFRVRDYGDTAVTNGDTLIDFTLNGQAQQARLRHLNVWRKAGDTWTLAIRQSVLLQAPK